MSQTSDDYGPVAAKLTPPIDALATVVIADTPVTTLRVPASSTLRVHLAGREGGVANEWDEYPDDEIPEPAGSVPADVHASARVNASAWVTITVDGERRTQVSATAGDRVTVHAEKDRAGGSA